MPLRTYPLLHDEENGQDFPLSGRIITFGSSKDCSLPLKGKGMLERMGHFLYREGQYHLQALHPSQKIRLDGKTVSEASPLKQNAFIEIGDHRFRYLEQPLTAIAEIEQGVGVNNFDSDTNQESFTNEQDIGSFGEVIEVLIRLLKDRDADIFATLVASVSRLLRCDAARVVEENVETGERQTIAKYPVNSGLERFSNRAIDWAKASPKTVLMQENEWEDQNSIHSLRANAVASILCVALRGEAGILGYLYMDRMRSGRAFSEKERALCDALSSLFVEILTNKREYQRQKETISRLQSAHEVAKSGIVHASQSMVQLLELAAKVARTDAAVLIRGETGTGKEMLARYLHEKSSREGKPFRALNCGAIPENLIESELFGHEKGAFTGADQRKIGLFEAAEGGTVFLDEIGDLRFSLQVKLLRVLQESEITRLGSTNPIRIHVRILSATHRDLTKEISEGRFRQDLYFRLAVLDLELPPLRARGQDVLLLAEFLLNKYLLQFGMPTKSLTHSARNKLLAYSFPGNVRELENVIQKAILLSTTASIGPDDLPAEWNTTDGRQAKSLPTLNDARTFAEREAIVIALEKTSGNISLAAKLLDIDRKWLMKLMDELNLNANEYRKRPSH